MLAKVVFSIHHVFKLKMPVCMFQATAANVEEAKRAVFGRAYGVRHPQDQDLGASGDVAAPATKCLSNCFSKCGFVKEANSSSSQPEPAETDDLDDLPLAQLREIWNSSKQHTEIEGMAADEINNTGYMFHVVSRSFIINFLNVRVNFICALHTTF